MHVSVQTTLYRRREKEPHLNNGELDKKIFKKIIVPENSTLLASASVITVVSFLFYYNPPTKAVKTDLLGNTSCFVQPSGYTTETIKNNRLLSQF